ncbi:MAG: tyrosine-type recombinase/integrase [Chloroflexi bacterium]|nr:tyrosine-type recombinase/integrase [Chloroflexota bacterium]
MTQVPIKSIESDTAGDVNLDILEALDSFRRHLRAANLSPKTIYTYTESAGQLASFLRDQGMPTAVAGITREHCEAWITHLLDNRSPATASIRFRGVQQLWKWLVEEGEIKQSPMARMRRPFVPENPPPVLRDDELRALLATCERGRDFEERRDYAIFRLFIDTGARLNEIAGLRWMPEEETENDVDLEQGLIRLRGKGRRERLVAIGAKAGKALDRYLRVRSRRAAPENPWLWIGRKSSRKRDRMNRLSGSGVAQMVRRRGREAGLGDKVHAHLFRHTFAHAWLSEGGQETDLMSVTGWRSRAMLQRYGASAAQERSWAAARRIALGDRL